MGDILRWVLILAGASLVLHGLDDIEDDHPARRLIAFVSMMLGAVAIGLLL